MTDLPIPFTAPMVRALLREIEHPGTGKTQTRRGQNAPDEPFDAIFNDEGVWRIGDALTGQRRGDVVRMGRQHVRDALLSVRQSKTGTALEIPIHTNLQEIIDATPKPDARRSRLWLYRAINEKSPHGCRKATVGASLEGTRNMKPMRGAAGERKPRRAPALYRPAPTGQERNIVKARALPKPISKRRRETRRQAKR